MGLRKHLLIGSASAVALAAAVPAQAQQQPAAPTSVSEIVVTGIRASLQRAIQIKRQSVDQVDAISSEDIGKLPDKNIADALQRMPGLNTVSAASGEGGFDENNRVSIRGTSPSLTNVTIDGHNVSTGDWFILDQFQTVGRSVSFDLLPSEIVQNIEVYKTQDASLLEGGVAGVVDIQTRNPLDLKPDFTFEGTAQGAYNTNSSETKPELNGLIGWRNADDSFGVIVQGFYEQRSVRRYGQETLGYTQITSSMPIGAANPSLVGVWAPSLIGSALFEQEKTRAGVDGAVQWRPNDKVEFKLTGFYSHLNATNHNDNYMYWGSNELNNNLPTSFTVQDNTLVAANWPLLGPNGKPVNGLVVDNIIRPDASGQSWFINLDGKFQVADHLTVKAQAGYTEGIGSTPTEPAFEVDGATAISYAPSGNGWTVNPTDINPASPTGLANDWAWNEVFRSLDREYYGRVDGIWDVDDGAFKDVEFGARIAEHTRQVDGWDRGCSLGTNGQCFSGGAMPFSATNPTPYPDGFNAGTLGIPGLLIPIAGDPNTIINILNSVTDPVRGPISHIVQPTNYYWPGSFKVHERDVEGYVMAHVGGDRWSGNFGVRFVDTLEDSYVNSSNPGGINSTYVTTSAYGNYYVDDVQNDYFDILPSINLSFDITPKLVLRASAAETMSRPDFSALGGSVSLTETNLTGNGGNPNLKPIKAATYDASLEWYYGPTSLAAVSVFYDDLSSYVSFGVANATYFCQSCVNASGGKGENAVFAISSPFNVSGELKGVEVQVQQPLAYGFGFQANATYADGHDNQGNALVGASKWTANVIGYFENRWVSARLAYTYRSHFFVGLDRSAAENQDNYDSLDGSIDFNVTRNIALTFDALNITNSPLKYYAIDRTQPRAVYKNGTQLFFGLRARF
ncbi:MAG TPA: TonB-dependent receptor [Caulobacteraceae bacterium]|nr:TonB-dependent receptor [Caulobacteraceae bacterium]